MLVTLSERVMSEVVRGLENLDPAMNLEEMTERMPEFSKRLFDYIAEFGVRFLSCLQVRGTLADFRFQLVPNGQDNRDVLTRGLAIMRPICISVEADDLPALVLNPAMLAGFRDHWPQLSPSFQRIQVSQLLDLIEQSAGHILNTPHAVDPLEQEFGVGDDEMAFRVWAAKNGLRVPDQSRRNREAAEARAIEERQKRERAAIEMGFDGNESASWGWREIS